MKAMNQAQMQNKDMLDQLSRSRAESLQIAEIARQDTGRARSAMWDSTHRMQREQAQRESEMRGRFVGQIGEEKMKSASLRDELDRQQQRLGAEQASGASLRSEMGRRQRQSAEQQRVGQAQLRSQQDVIARGNQQLKNAADSLAQLNNQIQAGNASVASLRDALKKADDDLAEARRRIAEANQARGVSADEKRDLQDEARRLKDDLARARRNVPAPAAPRAPQAAPRAAPAAAPIVVQGGSGGGGASSSAGGSSAASGGGSAARGADLSKIVEAVKQIAESSKKKGAADKAPKGGAKGITRARRTYTDKRKVKIAQLRALKSKRIREFNQKTKKMPAAERQKQRRAFKAKVNAQFKEMQQKFPTARGLKSVTVLRELIRKIDQIKAAK